MKKKIELNHKGKKIELETKVCNFFERFKGLMFIPKEQAKALLFDFKKPVSIPIHSFFVFFPFLVIWLNNKNKIIDIRFVKPFNCLIHSRENFSKILEIPMNKKYKEIIKILVGDRKI